MIERRLDFGSFTQKLCILYVAIWSVSPPLQIDMIYRIAALGCMVLWFCLSCSKGLILERTHIWAILFAMLVVNVIAIKYYGFSKTLSQISIYLLVIFFIVNSFYEKRWHELAGIHTIILILFCVWNFRTFSELLINPPIARLIVRHDEEIYSYMRSGVGGYSLVYPQVCIFPLVIQWILKSWKNDLKALIIGCVWCASYVLLISKAGYSIAITASTLSLFILFFYKKKSAILAISITVFLFVGALFLIVYSPGIQNMLLTMFMGTSVHKKAADLVLSAKSGQATGSILDRVTAYGNSLYGLMQYPIIGSLWKPAGGGHSSILDTFVMYGWFGGAIFLKMICSAPNTLKKIYTDHITIQTMNAVLVSIIFVGILDTFTYSFILPLLVLIPIFYMDILKWRIKSETLIDGKYSSI